MEFQIEKKMFAQVQKQVHPSIAIETKGKNEKDVSKRENNNQVHEKNIDEI